MNASPAAVSAPSPRRLLPLLIMMTATGPVALNILLPAVPQLIVHWKTDAEMVQLTVSLFVLSLATGQLLLGPLSDRYGRRPVVLGGLTLATVASLVGMLAPSIGLLIVARVVQAVGAATGVVIGRAIIRDLYTRERAAAMLGLVTTAMVVAPMLSPLIGGALDTAFGWEAIFLFVALFSAGVLLWSAIILPETRRVVEDASGTRLRQEWAALLASRRFYGYALCAAMGTAPFFLFIGGAPHVVVTIMQRSSAEYGLWFTLTSIGYMAGNFTVSRLSQRFGIDRMIICGLALSFSAAAVGLGLVALEAKPTLTALFFPQVVLAFGTGLVLVNTIAGAISVRPHAAGAASGIAGFIQMGTGAACAQLSGHLIAGAASAVPLATAMVVATMLGLIVYLTLVRGRSI